MNNYRIEYRHHHGADPIVIMEMHRPRISSRDFKIIKGEAHWLAEDGPGWCRATVLLNGQKILNYTVILDEPDVLNGAVNTFIYTHWPHGSGSYHSIRIVKEVTHHA